MRLSVAAAGGVRAACTDSGRDLTWCTRRRPRSLPLSPPRRSPYARLSPSLTDLSLSATLKLVLTPLVAAVPGFGAAIVSLARPPLIKFGIDFGPANAGASQLGRVGGVSE